MPGSWNHGAGCLKEADKGSVRLQHHNPSPTKSGRRLLDLRRMRLGISHTLNSSRTAGQHSN
jgi:hypothetical protein